MSRRESRPAATAPIAISNILSSPLTLWNIFEKALFIKKKYFEEEFIHFKQECQNVSYYYLSGDTSGRIFVPLLLL